MKTESQTSDSVHLAGNREQAATVSSAHVPAAIRNSFAWFAPASNECKPPKRGHPQDRKAAADFMRAQRARFHTLHGGWTRSEWNHQVSQAALNNLERMTDARKHVQALQEQAIEADLTYVCDRDARRKGDEEWYRTRELERFMAQREGMR